MRASIEPSIIGQDLYICESFTSTAPTLFHQFQLAALNPATVKNHTLIKPHKSFLRAKFGQCRQNVLFAKPKTMFMSKHTLAPHPEEQPKRLRGGYEEDELEQPKRLRGGYEEDEFDYEPDDIDECPEPEEMEEVSGDVDGAVDVDASYAAKYTRPPVTHTSTKDDLNLQWLDIDTISGPPLKANPSGKEDKLGAQSGQVPIIRIYGVNENGNSVAVFIHGFTSYAYFALPRGCTAINTNENLGKVRMLIEESLKAKMGNQGKDQQCCLAVKYLDNKKSIMGYDPSHTTFLQVYVSLPGMIPKLKTIMEEGMRFPGIIDASGSELEDSMMFVPYECNVPYVMRYMIDKDITGASWLTLPGGTYGLREEGEKGTWCQVSVFSCLASMINASDCSIPRLAIITLTLTD